MPHKIPLRQLYLFVRCVILGVGTWLIVNGAPVFFLIKDHLPL